MWILLGLLGDYIFTDQDLVCRLVFLQNDNQLKCAGIAVAWNKQIGSKDIESWLSELAQVFAFLGRNSRS